MQIRPGNGPGDRLPLPGHLRHTPVVHATEWNDTGYGEEGAGATADDSVAVQTHPVVVRPVQRQSGNQHGVHAGGESHTDEGRAGQSTGATAQRGVQEGGAGEQRVVGQSDGEE